MTEQINILAYANLIIDTKPEVGLAYKNSLMDNCLPCVVAGLLVGACNCLWPINQCPVYHVVHVTRCCEGVTNTISNSYVYVLLCIIRCMHWKAESIHSWIRESYITPPPPPPPPPPLPPIATLTILMIYSLVWWSENWSLSEPSSLICFSFVDEVARSRDAEEYSLSIELVSSTASTILALKVWFSNICTIKNNSF